LLGSFEEQQHRIARIIYLVTEIPEPPGFSKQQLVKHYSYEELHRFEKGEQDLYVRERRAYGRGARGGANWGFK